MMAGRSRSIVEAEASGEEGPASSGNDECIEGGAVVRVGNGGPFTLAFCWLNS